MRIEFECVADGVRLFSVGAAFTGTRAECARFVAVTEGKRAADRESNPHEDTEPIDRKAYRPLPRGFCVARVGAVA